MKMRVALGSFLLLIFSTNSILAQTVLQPARDPRAVAVLQQSFVILGGTVPADSVATGTVTIVAGSKTDTGTIRILTRGLDQTREEMLLGEGLRLSVYAGNLLASDDTGNHKRRSLEWAATAQSACNPLQLIAAALAGPDSAFEYVGLEETADGKAHHIRFWNSFHSKGELSELAEFSSRDIWIDAVTGLPIRVFSEQRDGRGAVDRIRLDVSFTDYRNVGGLLFPFRIAKALNGTPWATIRITAITLNNGLSDDDFPVEKDQP